MNVLLSKWRGANDAENFTKHSVVVGELMWNSRIQNVNNDKMHTNLMWYANAMHAELRSFATI